MSFSEEELAALVSAVSYAEDQIMTVASSDDEYARSTLVEIQSIKLKLKDALFWRSKFPPQQEMHT
jgi:hypothetical protein